MDREARNPRLVRRLLVRLGLLITTAGLAFAALVLPIATRPSTYAFAIGDVAAQDIQAPYAISYVSQVLTDAARQDAAGRVVPVYLQPDPAIARRQIEKLRGVLTFITVVRSDRYATSDQKILDLGLLGNGGLSPDQALSLLQLDAPTWETVQKESLNILEQAMRRSIRDDQIKEVQRLVPSFISFSLPSTQAELVAALVSPLITANSLLSEEQTQAARQSASDAIQPVTRSYVPGEIILRRGQVISAINREALEQFGMIRVQTSTKDYLAPLALTAGFFGFIFLYFYRRRLPPVESFRGLALIALVFITFLYAGRLIIPNRTVIPFLFPLPAFGLALACLFNVELGLVFSLVLSIFTAYEVPGGFELTVFYTLTSLIGVLLLGRGMRISSFIWAGVGIGAAGSLAVIAYRLNDPYFDLIGLSTLIGASFFNGFASASLALLFQYLFSQILGLTTALQLLEISRPDHPLLRFVLNNAPGTYQHSLQVSVLAEQAAERIGADPMLVRVGGLYHDAGKALNPSFFIENQMPGKLNPHDDLDPLESSRTIVRHVTDGVVLGRKYRLPPRIHDFMREHHGTQTTRYQYARALEAAGGDPTRLDQNLFRYPGPIPASKETALIMLADGAQARVRAEMPQTNEEIRKVVLKVVDFCLREGQLDNTRITLRDLHQIVDSFVETLMNTYHPRIVYPEIKDRPPELEGGEESK